MFFEANEKEIRRACSTTTTTTTTATTSLKLLNLLLLVPLLQSILAGALPLWAVVVSSSTIPLCFAGHAACRPTVGVVALHLSAGIAPVDLGPRRGAAEVLGMPEARRSVATLRD